MKKILFFFILFFIAVPNVYAVPATISFDPVEIKTNKDDTFKVNINIFTGNDSVASTDVLINYDPSLMEPLPGQTVNGDLFRTLDTKIISPGKLYVYGIDDQRNNVDAARGTLATLSFKALSEGEADLTFDCDQYVKNSSQIIKFNSKFQNIINCTSTLTHTSNVSISNSSILGAYTDNYSGLNRFTFLLGSIVVIFTCYIIIKYQRLHKDIS